MKKLLLLATALCCLSACNDKGEVHPAYKTPPVVGVPSLQPANPQSDEEVTVSVSVTSTYGLSKVYIAYYLDDNQERVLTASPSDYYSQDEVAITYVGDIPGQDAGTKVTFQIIALSHYGVGGWTEIRTYTVQNDN